MVGPVGPRDERQISNKYTLGEEVGRGGFATVFECRNSITGETVAVKRIGLRNLSKESLTVIEQEVALLKKLDHPNIVKYIDTVRTNDHLHIVLEFMENGSLARNIKLFGTLSQSLCALYIRQVLSGLAYLHEQGVIHRDIKAANILTTKQGLVKLADFGVATHTSTQSNEVVGTPYWMAPEIIEMSGPTTACDIWSVGCTIVELLTLKPPNFDIPPMAALYRIVQDEHPPLPEGLSPALREFLLLCFKKEPLLRSAAKDLLRHRWVHKARGIHEPTFVRADGELMSDGEMDTVDSRLDSPSQASEGRTSAATLSDQALSMVTRRKKKKPGMRNTRSSAASEEASVYAIHETEKDAVPVSDKERTLWRKSVMNTIRLSEEQRTAGLEANTDTNDEDTIRRETRGDFTAIKSDKKSLTTNKTTGDKEQDHEDDDDDDEEDDDDDDDEDWDDWDQDEKRTAAVFERTNQDGLNEDSDEVSIHGKQIRDQYRAMLGSRRGKEKDTSPKLTVGELDLDDLDGAFSEDTGKVSTLATEHDAVAETSKIESKLARFRESESAEDSFMEVSASGSGTGSPMSQDVLEVLRKRMLAASTADTNASQAFPGNGNSGGNEIDQFLIEFEDDDEGDFVEDAGRTLVAQQTQQVEKLIGLLRPDQDDETVLNACSKLTTLFREQPAQRRTLLTHHGVIPIMEMLEMSNTDVLHAVLKVVGQIIENDREFQELLALAGLIPIVAKFCRPSISRPIRLQAASLVKQFLKTSNITLQMLVACGGLPVLAGLLVPCELGKPNVYGDPDVALGCVAVDGIQRVFRLSSLGSSRGTIPKNDFCRLLAKEGVLRQLVALLEHCRSPKGEAECAVLGIQASGLVLEISGLLEIFAHCDSVVKQYFADLMVLEGILRTLTLEAPFRNKDLGGKRVSKIKGSAERELTQSGHTALGEEQIGPLVKSLLKCIKNLCMDPTILEPLEAAGVIPTLVPFLAYCSSMSKLSYQAVAGANPLGGTIQRGTAYLPGRHLSSQQEQLVKEVQNLVMLAMFYLTRLSHSRQEEAAVCGVIPYLMDNVAARTPSKTFALQILTEFAHTSDVTRAQLLRNDALDFYLDLLVSRDTFWEEKAFISLGAWLSNATPEVERAMLRPRSLQRLVGLFQSAQGNHFENYVKELLLMLTRSHRLSEAIGRSGLFMAELVARLSFPKAEVRINLLKMLKIIADHEGDLKHIVLEYNLFPVVAALSQDKSRVLVMEIASQLLDEWKAALL